MWAVPSWRHVKTLREPFFASPAFSPDGRLLLGASGRLWRVGPWTRLTHLIGHTDQLTHIAFAPGARLAVTSSDDRTARIWNVATGEPLLTLRGHNHAVRAAVFSRDGRFVATAGGGTARVWDPRTGDQLAFFRHRGLHEVGFSRDGGSVWTASRILAGDGTIRIFRCTPCGSLKGLMARADQSAQIRPWRKEELDQYLGGR